MWYLIVHVLRVLLHTCNIKTDNWVCVGFIFFIKIFVYFHISFTEPSFYDFGYSN